LIIEIPSARLQTIRIAAIQCSAIAVRVYVPAGALIFCPLAKCMGNAPFSPSNSAACRRILPEEAVAPPL
jgi:hypothetical protein